MRKRRIIYQNWVQDRLPQKALLQTDQRVWLAGLSGGAIDIGTDIERSQRIAEAVRIALTRLDPLERMVIEGIYYRGKSLVSLESESGRAADHLRKIHQRALRKLKRYLQKFVTSEFGQAIELPTTCPLCQNPERRKIDEILRARQPHETWRPVLKTLRAEFALTRLVPSQIIGHIKYH